ncbi:MAG TPA: PhzF family phenazine biosynthesis protein [Thermoanaerobaculia bacterium]|jgi:PhzF family phenazine biosynthesis protein|nr:PhzF family phenazine biosynthesis protein [Thermoanaerobaculia bacterium]
MSRTLPLLQVDAFTDRPFAGNPAAVCLLAAPAEAEWMQAVAREMNLSETAFVAGHGDGDFALRWFTPAVEVELCGHATLAAAHALWTTDRLAPERPARFHTHSGLLTAERTADGLIELDFPSRNAEPAEPPVGLAEALGLAGEDLRWVGRSRYDVLVELPSETEVRSLAPDLARLRSVEARGVIVTARAATGGRYDFVSRFFAPRAGVDEDPVTGSAHCTLATFWGERLGKTELLAYQASARGGEIRLRWIDDRVRLGGHAVTVSRGELMV